MNNNSITLLTIITEAALETKLIRDLETFGAPGYTITNAKGKGDQGVRDASWQASSNIRVEIICKKELSQTITNHLEKVYYDNYAMVTFTSEVNVLRPEKFIN